MSGSRSPPSEKAHWLQYEFAAATVPDISKCMLSQASDGLYVRFSHKHSQHSCHVKGSMKL